MYLDYLEQIHTASLSAKTKNISQKNSNGEKEGKKETQKTTYRQFFKLNYSTAQSILSKLLQENHMKYIKHYMYAI